MMSRTSTPALFPATDAGLGRRPWLGLLTTCLVVAGCAPREAPPVALPPPPAPVVVAPLTPPPKNTAPDWAPKIATVITAPDGRSLLALGGPAFPPGSTLDISDALGAPVGSALVLEPEAGKPPLARLIGLANTARPVAPGDHLALHVEPPPPPPAPVTPPVDPDAPPPGSLADLERLAKGKELDAVKTAQMARLDAERRWLELAARVLRLPPAGPELADLQERLRREIAVPGESKP